MYYSGLGDISSRHLKGPYKNLKKMYYGAI